MRCFVCYRELDFMERHWKIYKGKAVLTFCRMCCPTIEEVGRYVRNN